MEATVTKCQLLHPVLCNGVVRCGNISLVCSGVSFCIAEVSTHMCKSYFAITGPCWSVLWNHFWDLGIVGTIDTDATPSTPSPVNFTSSPPPLYPSLPPFCSPATPPVSQIILPVPVTGTTTTDGQDRTGLDRPMYGWTDQQHYRWDRAGFPTSTADKASSGVLLFFAKVTRTQEQNQGCMARSMRNRDGKRIRAQS